MRALRLMGTVTHVVPTLTDPETGRRRGGFGFIRCEGVADGELTRHDPDPLNVDHFFHARDTREQSVDGYLNRKVVFTPTPPPSPTKKPGAIEVEAAE